MLEARAKQHGHNHFKQQCCHGQNEWHLVSVYAALCFTLQNVFYSRGISCYNSVVKI